jgi:type I restriction enzyme S subunit
MTDAATATPRAGWRTVPFGEAVRNITERVEPAAEDSDLYVGLEHLDSGSLTVRRWGSERELEKTKLRMRRGDVLFAKRNAYLKRVAIAPHDGLFSAHGMVLRANPDLMLHEYLPFLMQSDHFMERALQISVGSLSPTINWKTLAAEEFALPPLEEQRRLVDAMTASESAMESARRLLSAAVGVRSSLAEALILPGTVRKLVLELGDGRLPDRWDLVTLGDLCSKVSDGPHHSPNYVGADRGVPFLSTRNVLVDEWSLGDVKHISPSDHAAFCKRAKPEQGDILYTKGGTTGIAKVNDLPFEFSVWVHVALLKVKRDLVCPHFLAFCLNTSTAYYQSQMYTHGTSNRDLGLTRMVKIRMPLPPRGVQDEIVQKLNAAVTAKRACAQRVDLADQQHRHLLNQACTTGETRR